MKAIIIDMDEIKKAIKGYSSRTAHKFHEKSSRLAKEAFLIAVEYSNYANIVLMGGGSASGKTEYISSELTDEEVIVFDATSGNNISVENRINLADKNKKNLEFRFIIPENIEEAFGAFIKRDRKVPVDVFFETHSGCRATMKWLIETYPNVNLKVILNKGLTRQGAMIVEELDFESNEARDRYILKSQLTSAAIEDIIAGIEI